MSVAELPESTPSREELVDQFARLLGAMKKRVAAAMPADMQEQMAGATPHQLEAVVLVAGTADGLTMHEIAEHQHCAMSTATALVDRLERQGLVERRDDPEDRRVVRIVSTEHAKRFIACAVAGKREMATKLLSPLDDDEVSELVTLLAKITEPGGE